MRRMTSALNSVVPGMSSCSSETAQEKAQREARQAYQDANDAYERAKKANDDFQNDLNNYYNVKGGN